MGTIINPKKVSYVGFLPCALALSCCDLGEAELEDGSKVTTTWGRNLTRDQAQWYLDNTEFNIIKTPMSSVYEIELLPRYAEKLLSIIKEVRPLPKLTSLKVCRD